MNDFYYYSDKVSKNKNHVIHNMNCSDLPCVLERTLIGFQIDFDDAIVEAKNVARKSNFEFCSLCNGKGFKLRDTKITKF